jgi:predicted amino acid racemase
MSANQTRYPLLEIDLDKLQENLAALIERCHDSCVEVAGVVKGATALPEVARVFARSGVRFVATSRIDQLRSMRAAGIDAPLMLIRVPMLSEAEDAVALSDASLQSDIAVIRAMNAAANRQDKIHQVLLMIDLGDLREGFWDAEEVVDVALEIENSLKNLRLIGVGVNLSCYGSVKPNARNMQGLVSLAADVEKAIGRPLEYVSGGASTSMYMVLNGTMPCRMNLLRLGEIVLTGQIYGCSPDFTHKDVFTLKAEVVECRDKPSFPVGELTVDAFGKVASYEDRGIRRRALVALGRVDYGDFADIRPRLPGVEILGASSDHTILDVEAVKGEIKVGDVLEFDVGYPSLVYLTNTNSVEIAYLGGESR